MKICCAFFLAASLLINGSVRAVNSTPNTSKTATPLTADAVKAAGLKLPVSLRRMNVKAAKSPTLIETAYIDVLTILGEKNACSDFFGGSDAATHVFSFLADQLQPRKIDESSVGIRMSGATIRMEKMSEPRISFRTFSNATVNSLGPFFHSTSYNLQREFDPVGHFAANTREARVLMLLHEMGHLMKGANVNWLLQDDGDNAELSRRNTEIIETKCNASIRALEKSSSQSLLLALLAKGTQPTTVS